MKTDMFCFQCQEAAGNRGCTKAGICGKTPSTASMHDQLLYVTSGLSSVTTRLRSEDVGIPYYVNHLITDNLYSTMTNVDFDTEDVERRISDTLSLKTHLISKLLDSSSLPEATVWSGRFREFYTKADTIGVLSNTDPDIRSLKQLIICALKGMSAYVCHANELGHDNPEIDKFIQRTLAVFIGDLSAIRESKAAKAGQSREFSECIVTGAHKSSDIKESVISWLVKAADETGRYAIDSMRLLDEANTASFGSKEISHVRTSAGERPGILVSGHNLRDLEMLLDQTSGKGIEIYTHSEMMSAHYYPQLKRYPHLHGNYGGAWHQQKDDFARFRGPIIVTSNCLVPPEDDYSDKLFTTGAVRYPGIRHIDGDVGEERDFGEVISMALSCEPPMEQKLPMVTGGFGHQQLFALTDIISEAVRVGRITRIVVMAGCDGRQPKRSYYSDYAERLDNSTLILTAGCSKFRFMFNDTSHILGLPRIIDAGQCNDSYSLVLFLTYLQDALGISSINELPVLFNISWYEQKAVAVLLALLHLGIRDIRLGPTLPAFLSPEITDYLSKEFGIKVISSVEEDLMEDNS